MLVKIIKCKKIGQIQKKKQIYFSWYYNVILKKGQEHIKGGILKMVKWTIGFWKYSTESNKFLPISMNNIIKHFLKRYLLVNLLKNMKRC